MARGLEWLCQPVATPQLRVFRQLFGAVMLLQSLRLLYYDRGNDLYLSTPFHYRWPGFEWVPIPSTEWQFQLHFVTMGVCSVVTGWYLCGSKAGRVSDIVLLTLYTWFFLWDAGYYNNHYYLTILLLFQFAVVGWTTASSGPHPHLRWHLLLFRFQFSVVYLFGGLAKLNWDWLNGYPARIWCVEAFERAYADVMDGATPPPAAYAIPEVVTYILCYGGLVLDLLAPVLLNLPTASNSRTNLLLARGRKAAIAATLVFHFANYHLFDIGVFPFLGAASAVLFCSEDELGKWTQVWKKIRHLVVVEDQSAPKRIAPTSGTRAVEETHLSLLHKYLVGSLLLLYVVAQLLVPLRHVVYHLNTNQTASWTGDGELFAWRMMLTSKRCQGRFRVVTDSGSGRTRTEKVGAAQFGLTSLQEWRAFQAPLFTAQLAAFVANNSNTPTTVSAVYVDAFCALNGHPKQRYLDPSRNLLGTASSHGDTMEAKPLWLPQWADERRR